MAVWIRILPPTLPNWTVHSLINVGHRLQWILSSPSQRTTLLSVFFRKEFQPRPDHRPCLYQSITRVKVLSKYLFGMFWIYAIILSTTLISSMTKHHAILVWAMSSYYSSPNIWWCNYMALLVVLKILDIESWNYRINSHIAITNPRKNTFKKVPPRNFVDIHK